MSTHLFKNLLNTLAVLLASVAIVSGTAAETALMNTGDFSVQDGEFPVLFVPEAALDIDADRSDWPATLPFIMESDSQMVRGGRQGPEDFSVVVRAFCDARHLYLFGDVADATPLLHKGGKNHQGDALEGYIGFREDERIDYGAGDSHFYIIFDGTATRTANSLTGGELEGAEIAVKPTDNGYAYEARIPLTNFQIDAARAGLPLWIDFTPDNGMGGMDRTGQIAWHGDGEGWQTPQVWRKARLTDDAALMQAPHILVPPRVSKGGYHRIYVWNQGQPWQGTLLIDGKAVTTDERGGYTLTPSHSGPFRFAVEIDGTQAVAEIAGPPKEFFAFEPGHKQSALVSLGADGTLAYAPYANQAETAAVNVIPDFSSAGYMRGGVAIPDLPARKALEPIEGDNRARIQAAIDEVAAREPDEHGFRGAVLLKAGRYEVGDTLTISVGGVVLRGEGQGKKGTVLVATKPAQHSLILLQGRGNGMPPAEGAGPIPIASEVVPVGANRLDVESTDGLAVGDTVAVVRTPNAAWIDAVDMRQYGWTADDYAIAFERVITAIDGPTLTLDMPMVDTIARRYGGGVVFKTDLSGRIQQAGVEDLRLESVFADEYDEQHGWNAVTLERAEHCWVRRVTARFFGYAAVKIDRESSFNTIEEVAMLDPKSLITGARRYSFVIEDGTGNLFQRCYARGGRHDFIVQSRVTGPNVFLDSYATDTFNDIGPHHRWATGTLFDSIRGGMMRVQNRKALGTGHGWAGAQTLFWNLLGTTVKVESPAGAMNWGIGAAGTSQQGGGYWEHWGDFVTPRSLYLRQLEDRLGREAVANIALPEQLDDHLWKYLAAWKGEGRFSQVVADVQAGKRILLKQDYLKGDENAGTDMPASALP